MLHFDAVVADTHNDLLMAVAARPPKLWARYFRDNWLPQLTEGGVNVKVGRMNTIIGWNGFLAPYRPLYSSDYQFFYSQDGAFTGALTQLVVSDQLDIWNGVTLGANTTLTSTGSGAITFGGTVNNAQTLTTSTAGITTFSGIVGGSTALTSVTTGGGGTTAINTTAINTTGLQN